MSFLLTRSIDCSSYVITFSKNSDVEVWISTERCGRDTVLARCFEKELSFVASRIGRPARKSAQATDSPSCGSYFADVGLSQKDAQVLEAPSQSSTAAFSTGTTTTTASAARLVLAHCPHELQFLHCGLRGHIKDGHGIPCGDHTKAHTGVPLFGLTRIIDRSSHGSLRLFDNDCAVRVRARLGNTASVGPHA